MDTYMYDRRSKQYKKAKKRVKEEKEFYKKLNSNLTTVAVLFIISYVLSIGFIKWIIFFIILSTVSDYFKVFKTPIDGEPSKEWEEKRMREEMERLRKEEEVNNKNKSSDIEDIEFELKEEKEEVELPNLEDFDPDFDRLEKNEKNRYN